MRARLAPTAPRTTKADLDLGQVIIVAARWVLIATGLVITLWAPTENNLNLIKLSLFLLLGLAFGNFYLQAQLLLHRPVGRGLVYATSAVDIAVITLITAAFGGLGAPMFVFYYPALLAFALACSTRATGLFTLGVLSLYGLVSVPVRPPEADLQILTVRFISLVAVAVVGNMYQRIESERLDALPQE